MTGTKYVAYVSTYTMGDNHGIKIYDVDMKKGRFTEKAQVVITNSSYVTLAKNNKYLYSINSNFDRQLCFQGLYFFGIC